MENRMDGTRQPQRVRVRRPQVCWDTYAAAPNEAR